MKIDPSTNSGAALTTGNGVQRAPQGDVGAASSQAGATPAASAMPSPDAAQSVSLSPLAAQLRGLTTSSSSDVDTNQVAQIKQAIANGTLTIDPAKIADGMLNTARDLLTNK